MLKCMPLKWPRFVLFIYFAIFYNISVQDIVCVWGSLENTLQISITSSLKQYLRFKEKSYISYMKWNQIFVQYLNILEIIFGIFCVTQWSYTIDLYNLAILKFQKENKIYVSPYNDKEIIAGQGTAGWVSQTHISKNISRQNCCKWTNSDIRLPLMKYIYLSMQKSNSIYLCQPSWLKCQADFITESIFFVKNHPEYTGYYMKHKSAVDVNTFAQGFFALSLVIYFLDKGLPT